MPTINLDPRKLLGFKVIANGESSGTLRSPKIGAKGCPVIERRRDAGHCGLDALRTKN